MLRFVNWQCEKSCGFIPKVFITGLKVCITVMKLFRNCSKTEYEKNDRFRLNHTMGREDDLQKRSKSFQNSSYLQRASLISHSSSCLWMPGPRIDHIPPASSDHSHSFWNLRRYAKSGNSQTISSSRVKRVARDCGQTFFPSKWAAGQRWNRGRGSGSACELRIQISSRRFWSRSWERRPATVEADEQLCRCNSRGIRREIRESMSIGLNDRMAHTDV
jgi:hypothetical protein